MSETTSSVNSFNVSDYYKTWADAASIKEDLDSKRTPLISICMNLTNDFNKSNVIRTGNAFLASGIYLVGRRKYDKRGTVGTHHYENVFQEPEFSTVADKLHSEGYTIYAVDNLDSYSPKSLWDMKFPERSAFVYGEEMLGLSDDVISQCDEMIYIPMFGSVRSLNVGTAAAIVMNEYSRQNAHLFS